MNACSAKDVDDITAAAIRREPEGGVEIALEALSTLVSADATLTYVKHLYALAAV